MRALFWLTALLAIGLTSVVSASNAQQTYLCDPTAQSQCLAVNASGQLTTALTGALPAGSNIIGKVGIDQTTPGTTNAVQVTTASPGGAAANPAFVQGVANGVPLAVTQATTGTQVQASASCAAAAICSVTLPAAVSKTTYLSTFAVTTGPPTAAVIGLATVSGPAATLNYYATEGTAAGAQLLVGFNDPVAASGPDTAIVVTLPAVTGGAVSAVTATGFQL